ncbi:putative ELMOD3 protein [Paratrimastix pyriformis]|uniref:ELMOD3 protein n=1 Tax=Paratrimastix pyriformis TaxID=342808 RepID=A0ABQ8UGU4_9EUKA|nr:putative ELMOD3 protein [Paratrimastix pyriformis]
METRTFSTEVVSSGPAVQPLVGPGAQFISLDDSEQFFMRTLDLSAEMPKIVPEDIQVVCGCCGPPKLRASLQAERDRIFALALHKFHEEETYHRVLFTIHRKFTGARTCSRIGPHWEEIGFQGVDPQTDLRSGGVLSLLQLLHLLYRHQDLAHDLFVQSRHPAKGFPLAVFSINLTGLCLEALRSGRLNRPCNQAQAVLPVFNTLYVAAFEHLGRIWAQGQRTIRDAGQVLAELRRACVNNPTALMATFDKSQKAPASRHAGAMMTPPEAATPTPSGPRVPAAIPTSPYLDIESVPDSRRPVADRAQVSGDDTPVAMPQLGEWSSAPEPTKRSSMARSGIAERQTSAGKRPAGGPAVIPGRSATDFLELDFSEGGKPSDNLF